MNNGYQPSENLNNIKPPKGGTGEGKVLNNNDVLEKIISIFKSQVEHSEDLFQRGKKLEKLAELMAQYISNLDCYRCPCNPCNRESSGCQEQIINYFWKQINLGVNDEL
jgi:hypothetical protein